MALKLGCIADDFTGATDLANNLARAGMRVVQFNGLPVQDLRHNVDATVIALKSRTAPTHEAVTSSLNALHWLKKQGSQQIYFKYCSTFDSWYDGHQTGNIGPVTEALMDAMGCDFTIATPAFPDNGRTVFKGHLFVGDALLADSSMRDHPVTPMRDSNLVRVMQAQCHRRVGLIDYRVVARGEAGILARIEQLKSQGIQIAILDAVSNDDLLVIGKALRGMALVTAGSGVAIGLPQNFGLAASANATQLPALCGMRAAISGSCSAATNRQIAHAIAQGIPAFAVDTAQPFGDDVALQNYGAEILNWARSHLNANQPILIYSTAEPDVVQAVQARCGREASGAWVERLLAFVARGLVDAGVGQLVVAGGETSGACVQALGVTQMQIGPQIDPGVPWCHAPEANLHLALKSGNFGTDDFFTKAFAVIEA